MYAGPFDLSNASEAKLSLYRWIKTQSLDEAAGDVFWIGANTSGPSSAWYGYYISGQIANWKQDILDLTDWGGFTNYCGESTVYIGFILRQITMK
jgi:hypothetical protein